MVTLEKADKVRQGFKVRRHQAKTICHTLHARIERTSASQDCWMNNINEDIESLELTPRGATDLTNDRLQWRSFIRTQ